jgi:hypothetical protein
MAAPTATPYNRARSLYGDGATTADLDLVGDSIKALLVSSAYVPNFDTHAALADITNELAGNGYARQTLANKTWARVGSGATAKQVFKSDKVTFSASGGALTARAMVLFKDTGTPATSILLSYTLLDSAPADVTSSTGIEVTPDATNGWLYL